MIIPVEVDVFGVMYENTYFYVDDKSKHGFLIDPGAESDKILEIIEKNGLAIEKILLTHGHYDHIGAVNEIKSALKIPVCMGKGGNFYAQNPINNGSKFFGQEIILNNVTILDETDIFLSTNPNFKLKVISTPGHTLDGTIYYSESDSVAFVGDTIFFGGHGRTDLAGGSNLDLMNSITKKIFALPDETILFCGHGSPTTVSEEKLRPWYQINR